MKTIKVDQTAEITEKKSKFICDIFYVQDVKEAEQKIEETRKKYYDAKHHCFAYRVIEENKVIEKASDDGEPSGTAGAPMLQLLSKYELVNVVAIVTRYFGGILLGTGGLVRAYTNASKQALENADFINLELGEVLKVPVSYQNLDYLKYYCNKTGITIVNTNFESDPYVIIEVTIEEKCKILNEMEKKGFDIQKIEIINKKYIQKIF